MSNPEVWFDRSHTFQGNLWSPRWVKPNSSSWPWSALCLWCFHWRSAWQRMFLKWSQIQWLDSRWMIQVPPGATSSIANVVSHVHLSLHPSIVIVIVCHSLHFNTFANGFHFISLFEWGNTSTVFFVGWLWDCSLNVGTTLHILYISPTSNLRLPIGKADGILVRLQLGTELCLRTLPRWKCHTSLSYLARKPGASTWWKARNANRFRCAETWFQILKSSWSSEFSSFFFVDVFLFVLRFHRTRPY